MAETDTNLRSCTSELAFCLFSITGGELALFSIHFAETLPMSQPPLDDLSDGDGEYSTSSCGSSVGSTMTTSGPIVELTAAHCRVAYQAGRKELVCMGTGQCKKAGHAGLRSRSSREKPGFYFASVKKNGDVEGVQPGTYMSAEEKKTFREITRAQNRNVAKGVTVLGGTAVEHMPGIPPAPVDCWGEDDDRKVPATTAKELALVDTPGGGGTHDEMRASLVLLTREVAKIQAERIRASEETEAARRDLELMRVERIKADAQLLETLKSLTTKKKTSVTRMDQTSLHNERAEECEGEKGTSTERSLAFIFYAIARGRSMASVNVYTSWAEATRETNGVSGAIHQSFVTESDAWDFIESHHGRDAVKEIRNLKKVQSTVAILPTTSPIQWWGPDK
ncbi:MAG: viroplasmin family protein [bacterium]